MKDLAAVASRLAEATRGPDWSAAAVQAAIDEILSMHRSAPADAGRAALRVLVDRLASSRPADADGVAHVAITAGTLVEGGAEPRPLGEVLLARLPEVLVAARRFATVCLAALPEPNDDDEELAAYLEVDQRAIPRELFREKLPADRAGGVALAYLQQWCLPAIAAWTRDREMLARAVRNPTLSAAAGALRASDAYFLHLLLGVELDAHWQILLPVEERGFDVRVDGLVGNFDVHALLADALSAHGVRVSANPRAILDHLRADLPAPKNASLRGSFNLYDWRAAAFELGDGAKVPMEVWVWGEGAPRDIPTFEGRRALLLGPSSIQRGWSAQRSFPKLFGDVRVEREWPREEARAALARMRKACG